MFRRSMLLLPALLAGLALSTAPALAGENDDDDGSATLRASSHDCVTGHRAKATVTGDDIDSVAFYVDGKLVKTATRPAVTGRYVFSLPCARLSVGAHRARAVVSSLSGDTETLRFQITRAAQRSPRFTG